MASLAGTDVRPPAFAGTWYPGDPGAIEGLDQLATALADLCDESTLLVASTDLSHRYDYGEVLETDREFVDLVATFDVEALAQALRARMTLSCGTMALLAVLKTARLRGARGARVLAYATSADADQTRQPGRLTVGYLAAAIYS